MTPRQAQTEFRRFRKRMLSRENTRAFRKAGIDPGSVGHWLDATEAQWIEMFQDARPGRVENPFPIVASAQLLLSGLTMADALAQLGRYVRGLPQ